MIIINVPPPARAQLAAASLWFKLGHIKGWKESSGLMKDIRLGWGETGEGRISSNTGPSPVPVPSMTTVMNTLLGPAWDWQLHATSSRLFSLSSLHLCFGFFNFDIDNFYKWANKQALYTLGQLHSPNIVHSVATHSMSKLRNPISAVSNWAWVPPRHPDCLLVLAPTPATGVMALSKCDTNVEFYLYWWLPSEASLDLTEDVGCKATLQFSDFFQMTDATTKDFILNLTILASVASCLHFRCDNANVVLPGCGSSAVKRSPAEHIIIWASSTALTRSRVTLLSVPSPYSFVDICSLWNFS